MSDGVDKEFRDIFTEHFKKPKEAPNIREKNAKAVDLVVSVINDLTKEGVRDDPGVSAQFTKWFNGKSSTERAISILGSVRKKVKQENKANNEFAIAARILRAIPERIWGKEAGKQEKIVRALLLDIMESHYFARMLAYNLGGF